MVKLNTFRNSLIMESSSLFSRKSGLDSIDVYNEQIIKEKGIIINNKNSLLYEHPVDIKVDSGVVTIKIEHPRYVWLALNYNIWDKYNLPKHIKMDFSGDFMIFHSKFIPKNKLIEGFIFDNIAEIDQNNYKRLHFNLDFNYKYSEDLKVKNCQFITNFIDIKFNKTHTLYYSVEKDKITKDIKITRNEDLFNRMNNNLFNKSYNNKFDDKCILFFDDVLIPKIFKDKKEGKIILKNKFEEDLNMKNKIEIY